MLIYLILLKKDLFQINDRKLKEFIYKRQLCIFEVLCTILLVDINWKYIQREFDAICNWRLLKHN